MIIVLSSHKIFIFLRINENLNLYLLSLDVSQETNFEYN